MNAAIHHDGDDLPLAVYGTLRPGGRAWQAFGLDRRTRHLGPCRILGRIVDLGGYPGLVEGPGEVAGDLLAFDDPRLLDELDAYEGEGYARETVLLAAPPRRAVLWVWRGPVEGARPVPGNDWNRVPPSQQIDPTA